MAIATQTMEFVVASTNSDEGTKFDFTQPDGGINWGYHNELPIRLNQNLPLAEGDSEWASGSVFAVNMINQTSTAITNCSNIWVTSL